MNVTNAVPGTVGGNREDIRGPLSILEPEETPFVSMCHKGPGPISTFHEVGADVLRKPRTSGSPEGSDGSKGGNHVTKRARFGAYLHRWHDTYGVTDVQQAITKAGGNAFTSDELGTSEAKTIREVKRDLEATCCSDIETQAPSAGDMQTRGAFKWLAASTVPAVPADFITPAAQRLTSVTTLTEDNLVAILTSLKTQYGGARTFEGLFGSNLVNDVDRFTRTNDSATNNRYQVHEMATSHEITLMVKTFVSSMGRVNVIPTEFNRVSATTGLGDADSGLILNMELWSLEFLDELHTDEDPVSAGGESGWVLAIGGLFCKNPKGNGSIINT